MPHPERLSRRTRGYMRMGGADPATRCSPGRARRRRTDRERANRIFADGFDLVVMPLMFARRPPKVMYYDGRNGVLDAELERALAARTRRCSTTRASRPPRCPPASPATASRCPCSSSRRPTARACCSRSPPSSSASATGPRTGRRRRRERGAARARRARRPRGGRPAARGVRRAGDRGRGQEHADRPRLRGRPGRRGPDPRAHRRRAARRRLPGRGGRRRGGQLRAALGRRPARRHDQLPVRHPAVGGQSSRARTPTACSSGVVYDPPRDELWAAERGGPATARRRAGARLASAPSWRRRWWRRASATTPRCGARRPRRSPRCCPRCATSAASARPRSTSPGAPPGASTPTTSAA